MFCRIFLRLYCAFSLVYSFSARAHKMLWNERFVGSEQQQLQYRVQGVAWERKRRRCRSSCRNSAWIKRWRRSSTLEEHGTAKKGREIVQNFDQTRSTDDNRISNVYDIVRNIAYPTGCKMLQIGVGSLQSPQAEAVVLTLHICHFIVFFVHQHLWRCKIHCLTIWSCIAFVLMKWSITHGQWPA